MLPVSLLLAGLLLCSGCKKSDNTSTGPASTTSEGDAGNIVAGALGGGDATGGMAAQVADGASIAMGMGLPSSSLGKTDMVNVDTTVVRQFVGALRQYSYTFMYHWLFSNSQLTFSYTMRGGYSTPILAGQDSAIAAYTIGGIGGPDTMLTFQGSYTRLGFETLKTKNNARVYTYTTVTFTGLGVSKRNRSIMSGTANVSIQGYDESTGAKFFFSCTLTFIGNQQASMIVNGKTFIIDLSNGTATPA